MVRLNKQEHNPVQTRHTVLETILEHSHSAAHVARGLVLSIADDGSVDVDVPEHAAAISCWLLHTSEKETFEPRRGDAVLVWLPPGGTAQGVVLGRIGPATVAQAAEPPAKMVIEAREQLTLKCGEGSITLRGDGKVLIQGKDLVSRAQRTNRIKGGSVAIN
jgi:hypothetical protein